YYALPRVHPSFPTDALPICVYSYLRESRQSPEEIADRLGYASQQQCWRHVKLVTGFGFSALREQLEPRAFIEQVTARLRRDSAGDRKSTRLNSSHVKISYAV